MAKFCAFVVSAVLVFPAALIAVTGIALLAISTVGITVSDNLNVVVLALFVFAAAAAANAVYHCILRRMTRETG